MSSPFCGKTGKPHSQYLGVENFCPGCGKEISVLLQVEKPTSLLSSTPPVKSIITLLSDNEDDVAVPTLTTARFPTFQATASTIETARFPTFQATASTVETARQTAISKTQNATGRGRSFNAGAKTLTSQHKPPKSVPVMENVKVSIVKGVNGAKSSFSLLGLLSIL